MDNFGTVLTSGQNPRVKNVVKLRQRRMRDSSELFLIEGYREILRAVGAGVAIEQMFVCPEFFLGTNERALLADVSSRQHPEFFHCREHVFQKISYRDRPDGLLAVAKQKHRSLQDLELVKNPFLVVAEAIEKPGNLGTILRSSDAVGVDGVIVCDRCTDVYNPNVVRASVGTLFTVPVVESSSEEVLCWLRKHGIAIVASTPSADSDYTEVDLTGPIALGVGTEQLGLSDQWLRQADIKVKIPMRGVADSLNVAMATTVLLYEAIRQRGLL